MFKPTLELLENRALLATTAILSNGVLRIVGTEKADQIVVRQIGDQIRVNGKATFAAADVGAIEIDARGGNDNVSIIDVRAPRAIVPWSPAQLVGPGGCAGSFPDLIFRAPIFERIVVHGGAGNDRIVNKSSVSCAAFGDAGNDFLGGGSGNDLLSGGTGNDHLLGMHGNDTLLGDAGNDFLQGGDGDDCLYGGLDRDRLHGGTGNDRLDGGFDGIFRKFRSEYRDFLRGDAGNDIYVQYRFWGCFGPTVYSERNESFRTTEDRLVTIDVPNRAGTGEVFVLRRF